jgi:hypothetical protein
MDISIFVPIPTLFRVLIVISKHLVEVVGRGCVLNGYQIVGYGYIRCMKSSETSVIVHTVL